VRVHAIIDADASTSAAAARLADELGFDGVTTTETTSDPFLPLVPAAGATESGRIGTAIAVALPRSPLTLATLGHDLQRLSAGRFWLGLGSQVRAHVERRFSAPWDRPAARMRDMVLAIRAIWRAWQEGERLDYQGDFYRHTLMPPMFDPGPSGFADPAVVLAAVGPRMTAVAAEVADGMLVHGFTTPSYLREVVVPQFHAAAVAAGRDPASLRIVRPVFLVTGATDEAMASTAAVARERVAFYGSTPGYRGVLEHHGWGDLQQELAALVRDGRWDDMADVIDDEVLAAFAVVAPLETLADAIAERYVGVVDDLSFRLPRADLDQWAAVLSSLRQRPV
jgi:probable F420-dependent oxidoreductase